MIREKLSAKISEILTGNAKVSEHVICVNVPASEQKRCEKHAKKENSTLSCNYNNIQLM